MDGANTRRRLRAGLLGVGGIVVVGATALILVSIARAGVMYFVYVDMCQWASVRLGLDYFASTAFGAVAAALVTSAGPGVVWYFMSGKKRVQTACLLSAVALVAWLLVSLAGSNVYFDRHTGAPLRWYADTPAGRTYSYSPGYDPRWGVAFKPYTIDTAREEAAAAAEQHGRPANQQPRRGGRPQGRPTPETRKRTSVGRIPSIDTVPETAGRSPIGEPPVREGAVDDTTAGGGARASTLSPSSSIASASPSDLTEEGRPEQVTSSAGTPRGPATGHVVSGADTARAASPPKTRTGSEVRERPSRRRQILEAAVRIGLTIAERRLRP